MLEWGQESQYSGWFDIDWSAHEEGEGGKLLAPVLGEQYGEALRSGKLALRFDESDGTFAVWAYDVHKLPVSPVSYATILGRDNEAIERLGDRFRDLPNWRPEIAERALDLKARLAALARDDASAGVAIETRVALFNSDWRELERLIAKQRWRVAFFRVAEDEVNYRRFFNINDLAGLRVELGPVFRHAHERVFAMLRAGVIEGLRIDHIDGLFDPKAYLTALREDAGRPFYCVVEKILAPHEQLRADWPVDGTTGYDFINLVLGVLIDPSAEAAFDETYRAFAGVGEGYSAIAIASKLRMMDYEMASELGALARAAARLARSSAMTADLTRAILERALRLIIANFPVYRAYLDLSGTPDDADLRDIAWAVARARRAAPDLHPSAFDFLEAAMKGDARALGARELSRTAALRFAMRMQQVSGPVMAKGIEDTAFYRFNRFVALNEVGGSPDLFGYAPSTFHKANAQRAERRPHAMLASATHDTKRGEDARARLAVLSERPDEWRRQVAVWSRLLRARLGDVEGVADPDRNDEYMLYQMLLGSWPMEMLEAPSAAALAAYAERIRGALTKSMREAKLRTGWAAPNLEYEEKALAFASEALRPDGSGFLAAFLPFVADVARLGVENSLVQTVLKFTALGVPDTFQGAELWDLSLVDPDNRRPVDYPAREAALGELQDRLASPERREGLFGSLMESWRDGRAKLATIALLLALRRKRPALFADGAYRPLAIEGEDADVAFGYARERDDERLAIVVARFPMRREARPGWEAFVKLPEGRWTDVVRNKPFDAGAPLREALGPLPFVVLEGERGV